MTHSSIRAAFNRCVTSAAPLYAELLATGLLGLVAGIMIGGAIVLHAVMG